MHKEDDADDGLQFQELRNLHELVIKGIPNLVSLPKIHVPEILLDGKRITST